jgi:multimeric flavodoxin WrbA
MALKWNQWNEMAKRLKAATGFIFISPEYGGMVPPRLMNFLLLCSGEELGHKPALAVGISAGRGGAYPITELRAYGYKNNHLCWLPDHLIIRNVEAIGLSELLDGQSSLNKTAVYSLRLLDQYARALTVVRASGVVDHEGFPYGM